jgi:hypothetical protein
MAKTYTAGSGLDKDRARLRLGDTTDGSMVLDNAEIEDLLTTYGFQEGTAQCAEAIAAYWSSRAEKWTEGDQQEDFGDRAEMYFTLAREIRATQQNPSAPKRTGSAVGDSTRPTLIGYRNT